MNKFLFIPLWIALICAQLRHRSDWASLIELVHPSLDSTDLCPAKTQISQIIHSVYQSSLCAQWVAKDSSFSQATTEALIRLNRCSGWSVSLGASAILLVLSCAVSIMLLYKWCNSSWCIQSLITKTCLYNFDPIQPYFCIVKQGFTGVCIIFLISAQKIDCGYSLEPPRQCGSNEYPQSMSWAEIWKMSEFSEIFLFSVLNFQYIWIGVFSKC